MISLPNFSEEGERAHQLNFLRLKGALVRARKLLFIRTLSSVLQKWPFILFLTLSYEFKIKKGLPPLVKAIFKTRKSNIMHQLKQYLRPYLTFLM